MAITSDFRSGSSGLVDGTDASTYTYTAADIGTATSDRLVLSGFNWRASSTRTVSSVTIAGIAATAVSSVITNSGNQSVFYIAAVPTGTTGDIVITLSGTALRCQVGVWALTGASATATDSQNDTTFSTNVVSVSMSCVAGGAIYALANISNAGSSTGWGTWVGVTTERFDAAIEVGSGRAAGASNDFASAQSGLTVSATASGTVGTTPILLAIALPPYQSLTPPTFTNNAGSFGTSVVSHGLTATNFSASSSFGTPAVTTTYDVAATKFTSATATFGTPVVATPSALSATKFTNTSTFFTPVVAGGSLSLLPTKFTNSSTFGTPVITTTSPPYRPQVRSGMWRRHMGW